MPRRPPKKFFGKILKGVKKQYPSLSEERQAKISASVYHKLSPAKKTELAKREGNPKRKISKKAVLKSIKALGDGPMKRGLVKYARKRGWL